MIRGWGDRVVAVEWRGETIRQKQHKEYVLHFCLSRKGFATLLMGSYQSGPLSPARVCVCDSDWLISVSHIPGRGD